jgi:hypothetical protein
MAAAAMAAMTKRVTNVLPTVEAEVVDTISQWCELVGPAMTADAARKIIEHNICERLQAGTLATATVIAMADAGHQGADLALRAYAATFIDHGREAELSAQVRAYVVQSLLRPFVTYPKGHNVIDTFTRDIGIAVMVSLAAERWAMPPTRGRSTEDPAAAYFVALALRQRGIAKLKEQQVSRIYPSIVGWRRDWQRLLKNFPKALKNVQLESPANAFAGHRFSKAPPPRQGRRGYFISARSIAPDSADLARTNPPGTRGEGARPWGSSASPVKATRRSQRTRYSARPTSTSPRCGSLFTAF